MKKRQYQVFNFLFHPDVLYDNNGSERGSEIFAILRSVFDTTIKKGGNPFETIRIAVNLSAKKKEFQLNRLT